MKAGSAAVLFLLAACAKAPEGLRSDDPERARAAAEEYLARGEAAIPELRELLKDADPRTRKRARNVLARLTGQWGGDGTGIVWKRTFEDAVAESKRTGKPILCLNLFGRFDEEFC